MIQSVIAKIYRFLGLPSMAPFSDRIESGDVFGGEFDLLEVGNDTSWKRMN